MTLGDEYKTLFYGPDPDLAFSAFFVFLLFLQNNQPFLAKVD
jgi:hypothetical protein